MTDKKQNERVVYIVGDRVSAVNDLLTDGWHIKEMHACGCRESGRLYVWLVRNPNSEEPA